MSLTHTIKHNAMIALAWLIPNDKLYLKAMYRIKTGRKLHLAQNDQMRFTEKMQWLKLYDKNPSYTGYVDKSLVKSMLKELGGGNFIDTLGVYDNFDDIDFDKLPNRFVLKCTHDSGGLVICKDKQTLDKKAAKRKINKCLKSNFFRITREYPYKEVRRRIIAEPFMEDEQGKDLTDYKFYCFGGRAEFCQLIEDRTSDETIDFYDREWKHQDFIGLSTTAHHARHVCKKPYNYNEMLAYADKLAMHVGAPFVRIDLYNIKSKIFFGEVTFFPASGFGQFQPDEWDFKLGSMIPLPVRYNECKQK